MKLRSNNVGIFGLNRQPPPVNVNLCLLFIVAAEEVLREVDPVAVHQMVEVLAEMHLTEVHLVAHPMEVAVVDQTGEEGASPFRGEVEGSCRSPWEEEALHQNQEEAVACHQIQEVGLSASSEEAEAAHLNSLEEEEGRLPLEEEQEVLVAASVEVREVQQPGHHHRHRLRLVAQRRKTCWVAGAARGHSVQVNARQLNRVVLLWHPS